MSYKPFDDRQVVNRAALPNIGTPANTTVDVILADIDAALAGITNNAGYIAKELALSSGITSVNVTIPAQPDASFVVLAMLRNTTDSSLQYQQPLIQNKTTTGFTVLFNAPLASANYVLNYIIPFKSFTEGEQGIGSGSVNSAPSVLEGGSNYGVIAELENYSDSHPQFQSVVITAQTSGSFTSTWNAPLASGNYFNCYVAKASGKIAVVSGTNSVTISVPTNFVTTTNFATIAVMVNTTDAAPQFQPLLVNFKNANSFGVSWNTNVSTSNYSIYYYVISFTT